MRSAATFLLFFLARFVVRAVFDQYQVISKVGLDRTVDLAYFLSEDDIIEGGHHLPGLERAQASAFRPGRTRAVLRCQGGEIALQVRRTRPSELRLEVLACLLVLHKNMDS